MLDVIVFCITLIAVVVVYTILVLRLNDTNKMLMNYIMAQKDIVAFKSAASTQKELSESDKKLEQKQKEYKDYMDIVNTGVVDEKDIRRFGTMSVYQG